MLTGATTIIWVAGIISTPAQYLFWGWYGVLSFGIMILYLFMHPQQTLFGQKRDRPLVKKFNQSAFTSGPFNLYLGLHLLMTAFTIVWYLVGGTQITPAFGYAWLGLAGYGLYLTCKIVSKFSDELKASVLDTETDSLT